MSTPDPTTAPDDPVAFFGSIATGPWADPDDPTNRLARALVSLAEVALDVRTDAATVAALAARVEDVVAAAPAPARPATRYRDEDRPAGRKVRPNATGKHPLAGPANPAAPPLALRREGDRAFATAVYDLRFEGLPGLVQGGFVAAAFDLVLGQAVALSGSGGMTGGLSVRYVSPTPLYELLEYRSWFDRAEGRKTFAAGELVVVATGRLCATAEGVFIAPKGGLPGSVD